MIIVLEGIDNSGKSTLAALLSKELGWPIQASEGPPKAVGEIDERLKRYAQFDNYIFDRHPAVSQEMYSRIRNIRARPENPAERMDKILVDQFYNRKPIFIYCDSFGRGLEGHVTKKEIDSEEHLKAIENNWGFLLITYREWAMKHAHFIYRIGDDPALVMGFVRSVVIPPAFKVTDDVSVEALIGRLPGYVPPFNPVQDIRDFHEKFMLEYNGPPRNLPDDLFEFRARFMREELIDEYQGAQYLRHPMDRRELQFDALIDLVYVALGTAYLHGFPFEEGWRRVHAANMSKIRAMRAADSKRGSTYDVVKPPGWKAPDLSDLVSDGLVSP